MPDQIVLKTLKKFCILHLLLIRYIISQLLIGIFLSKLSGKQIYQNEKCKYGKEQQQNIPT